MLYKSCFFLLQTFLIASNLKDRRFEQHSKVKTTCWNREILEKIVFCFKEKHYLVLFFHLFIIIFGLWRYARGKVCNWYRTWIGIYLFDWFGIFDNNVPWFKSWIITISDIQNPFFWGFDLKIIIFTNWLNN